MDIIHGRDFRVTAQNIGNTRCYFKWCPASNAWRGYRDGCEADWAPHTTGAWNIALLRAVMKRDNWIDFAYVMDPIDVLIDEVSK